MTGCVTRKHGAHASDDAKLALKEDLGPDHPLNRSLPVSRAASKHGEKHVTREGGATDRNAGQRTDRQLDPGGAPRSEMIAAGGGAFGLRSQSGSRRPEGDGAAAIAREVSRVPPGTEA